MTETRVLLAVDADNLYINKPNGTYLNYKALMCYAKQFGALEAAYFYAASRNPNHTKHLMDCMVRIGFTHAECRACRFTSKGKAKSDVDTKLTIDVVNTYAAKPFRTLVLASGDSDFLPLIEYLSSNGVQVYVVGPKTASAHEMTRPPIRYTSTSDVKGFIIERND